MHPYKVVIRGIAESGHFRVDAKRGSIQDAKILGRVTSVQATLYVIDVKCGVSKWTVHRTFVDFSVLHRILCQTYPTISFPILPSRADEKNKNFVAMRGKLQAYLRELIDCSFEESISHVERERVRERRRKRGREKRRK